jgi:hypothetical protein
MHRKFFKFLVYIFAFIGFGLTMGFFAVRLHLTDVSGIVDAQSYQYNKINQNPKENEQEVLGEEDSKDGIGELEKQITKLQNNKNRREKIYCAIDIIGKYFPVNSAKIIKAYDKNNFDSISERMILALKIRVIENQKNEKGLEECEQGLNLEKTDEAAIKEKYKNAQGDNAFPWINQPEWKTIAEAIVKDKDQIKKASYLAGVEPRMLVASAIVEQLRLFNSNRELYKKFFSPLKILGSANKISLGIMGIKENTAIQIENNLKDSSSPYYLGKDMENVLEFKGESNISNDRFEKLSSDKNHYPNYLYGAVYLKQMLSQWEKAGYDIKYRPEIVGTLFNVGFPQSKPNANPKVGGSSIDVGIGKYSFGSLAYEFYYSGELLEDFPFE